MYSSLVSLCSIHMTHNFPLTECKCAIDWIFWWGSTVVTLKKATFVSGENVHKTREIAYFYHSIHRSVDTWLIFQQTLTHFIPAMSLFQNCNLHVNNYDSFHILCYQWKTSGEPLLSHSVYFTQFHNTMMIDWRTILYYWYINAHLTFVRHSFLSIK